MLSKVSLYLIWNEVYEFFAFENGVQQECSIVAQTTSYIVHVEVSLNVASHKVRRIYLIWRMDWLITEAKMWTSETTRLLRIVAEISLTVFTGVITNNLNRVLVGTNCTVSTQAIELSFEQTCATHWDFLNFRKWSKSNIVYDAHCEVVLWHRQLEVVEHRDNLGWSCIWRAETIATTDNQRFTWIVIEGTLHIEIQWFAFCSRFLGTVEYGNALDRRWDCFTNSLNREWTI